MTRIAADPVKKAEYLMKRKLWGKREDVVRPQYGMGDEESLPDGEVNTFARMQQETRHDEMLHAKRPKQSYDTCCMLPLCHPFTAVVSGLTGCGKTTWVL